MKLESPDDIAAAGRRILNSIGYWKCSKEIREYIRATVDYAEAAGLGEMLDISDIIPQGEGDPWGDQWSPLLSNRELEGEILGDVVGTGLIDVEALAERLARGRGEARRAQFDHYAYTIRGILEAWGIFELIERDHKGHNTSTYRCIDPALILDNYPAASAHLRIKHDGSADPAYYRDAMRILAGRRDRERGIA